MKNLQLFIHRHYDAIKLGLIVVIFALTFVAVIGNIQQAAQNTIEREEAVKELLEADRKITDSIKDETEAQTKIINRQFRALCILIIDTSGEEGLAKLDADSRAQCERLADDPELTQETAVEQQQTLEQEARQEPGQSVENNGSSSNRTPNPQSNQRDNPQREEPPEPTGLRRVPGVNRLLNWLGL